MDLVEETQDGAVTRLMLNQPERRNALSIPLRAALIERLEAAQADETCRAIIITGAGGHFCAGGDITSMADITGVAGRRRMAQVHRLVRLIVGCEKPVIAAVEGHAIGAGLSLAAICDIVVASQTAKFTCSFNRIGLVPDVGAAWSLPLRMGMGRAKFAMMTGRSLTAAEAERWGLAEMVVPAGEAEGAAMALGGELATRSPLSNGFAKALLARMPRDLDEMLRAEADAQAILYASEDLKEGRAAFLERREPEFRGH